MYLIFSVLKKWRERDVNLTLQCLENLHFTEFASQWGYDLALLPGRGLLLQNVLRFALDCEDAEVITIFQAIY